MFFIYVFIQKTILTNQKLQFCNYHKKSQIEMINLENPLMLIAQIYYLTLNARELTRPMCFDLSRDARAAIACRVSFASYVFSALGLHILPKWRFARH